MRSRSLGTAVFALGLLSLGVFTLGSTGCADGRGVIEVTLTKSGAPIVGVASFQVSVSNAGADAGPYTLVPSGAPVSIPPDQTFTLSFNSDRRGPVHLLVLVLDEKGGTLTSAEADTEVSPSEVTQVSIDLGSANGDGGTDLGDGGGDMGDASAACGMPGTPCCSTGMPCSAGCCAMGMCQLGITAGACGATGGACSDCTQSAVGGACIAGACGCQSSSDCPTPTACNFDTHACGTSCGQNAGPCHNGCCDSTGSCQAGNANATCGTRGGSCVDCAVASGGKTCVAGVCGCSAATDCPTGYACTAGACTVTCGPGQSCNGGCCDGTRCQPGNTNGACGTSGMACVECAGGTPSCTGGSCTSTCSANGVGGAGGCGSGFCCNAANQCVSVGNTMCGVAGGACADCTSDPNGAVCVAGKCGCKVSADCPVGTACVSGLCSSSCNAMSGCNGGCCNAGTCVAGGSTTACGLGGACIDCTSNVGGHACVGGSCGCNSVSDCPPLFACDPVAHLCTMSCDANRPCNGTCCNAATDGSCAPGTNNNLCGSNGGLCSDCGAEFTAGKAGKVCIANSGKVGGACGCATSMDCPTGRTCVGGLCTASCSSTSACNAGCCSAASNGSCQPGTAATACGDNGVCADCTQSLAGHVCVASLLACGCNGASDCPTPLSCNLTTHKCEATCGDSGHSACNNGCCGSNNQCKTGKLAIQCGTTGGACVDCSAATTGHACLARGTCGCTSAADCPSGLACDTVTGTCTTSCGIGQPCNGGCCTATSGGSCRPGTGNEACGTSGICIACSGMTPTCSGGACINSCGAGRGVCSNGSCCSSGKCVGGTQQATCGFSGDCNDCAGNPSGTVCETNVAGTAYCGCMSATDCLPNQACTISNKVGTCGAVCGGGVNCNGGCCDGKMCQVGTGPSACGGDGMTCADCTASSNGHACVTVSGKLTCGCASASDCPSGTACNKTTQRCENKCGDAAHTLCNNGCCLNGQCARGTDATACGNPSLSAGTCVDCTQANPRGHLCITTSGGGICGCNAAASTTGCDGGYKCSGTTCCGNGLAGCGKATQPPCCSGLSCSGLSTCL